MHRITFLMFICLLAGCAASGPDFQLDTKKVEKDNIMVYIFRPDPGAFIGGNAWPNTYVNGEYIGSLKSGGYLKVNLPRGENEIYVGTKEGKFANWSVPPVSMLLKETNQDEYFIKMDVVWTFGQSFLATVAGSTVSIANEEGYARLTSVSKEEALNEISKTKLSN
ncbi:hypothetical protein FX988_00592 [Paraglaciecola mesophila]|uniref:DUF2846 domain-containing protein n=1 Tax=Paraglaciecola mesophila TaxID=197222 RepID=A0A857JGR4_9ALTE|nr:hypothetical protein [Paraglaciecola mesophila]QHJ10380.1 hypothetical protein FX988_00592 [Paraglaciecola mesophila]